MTKRIINLILFLMIFIYAFSGYKKIYENENYNYYFNEEKISLRIEEKAGDKIWNSVIDQKDSSLNTEWQNFASSGISFDYMNSDGQIKRFSVSSENSDIKYYTENGILYVDIYVKNLEINLKIRFVFSYEGFKYEIPEPAKEKNENYKIQNIYIFPFFEAVKNSGKGYIFIPDGSGAVISLEKATAKNPFTGRIYGDDYGVKDVNTITENDYRVVNTKNILIPVYGMAVTENEKGFMNIVTGGEEYSEIMAYQSGIITNYSWVTSRFIYRETYKKFLDKKGNAILVNMKDPYTYKASSEFILLRNEDSGYVGMALKYREFLQKNGILTNKTASDNIPLKIDIFAAETKKKILGKEYIKMTDLDDVKNIISDFKNYNVIFNIEGYSENGYSNSFPENLPISRSFADNKDFKQFNSDNNVYYTVDYLKGNNIKDYDTSQNISKQLLELRDGNKFLNPYKSAEMYKKQSEEFEKYNVNNFAFRSSGKYIYSDYGSNFISRTEMKNIFSENFKGAFYNPNSYMWKNTSLIFDIDLDSSGYVMENYSVPFLEIVLKNNIDFFSGPLNINGDLKTQLLKIIEYSVYPSFTVTAENSVKLMETNSEWLFSSEYDVWKDKIKESYEFVNNALKYVTDSFITGHKIIGEKQTEVTYSDGIKIIINYSDKKYKYGDNIVEPFNYIVIKGENS